MTRAFLSVVLISAVAMAVDTRPVAIGQDNIVSGVDCTGRLVAGLKCPGDSTCNNIDVMDSNTNYPRTDTPIDDFNCNSRPNGSGGVCDSFTSKKDQHVSCTRVVMPE